MLETITLHPSRIGCPSIPGTMKGIVSSLPGVSSVEVRYEERALDVTFDSGVTTPETIMKTIGAELGLRMEVGEAGGSKIESPAETCPM
ncbi:MAG: heavy-metal-associated domain-containing protein [bacterium]|nr:heavy-metal-associated domain-containing protein [bacterium]MDZ4285142.1 heavy-metal-associated domain-containing protein [Patescibacteria group bacterium]